MRIEAYNTVQNVYGSSKVSSTGKTEKAQRMDAVQISSIGKDIQVAKQAVKDAPDVREELISPLREKVQNGTYDVSSDDFADKMLANLV